MDDLLNQEQQLEAVAERIGNIIHLMDGMNSKHPFAMLAMRLAQEIQMIVEDGYVS